MSIEDLIRSRGLDPVTEGDATIKAHAEACGPGGTFCKMHCRCWCHGFTRHPDGSVRSDWRHAAKDYRKPGVPKR